MAKKTNTAANLPTVHSLVRGDITKDFNKLTELDLTNKIVHRNIKKEYLDIPMAELIPLETQRETDSKWVVERQKARAGLDMVAFGALNVACDPNDNKYYVYDGCGRLAIAQFNGGLDTVPCMVYHISKEEAAYYFKYNQEDGRRRLSREVTFVNAIIGGDESEKDWVARIEYLGVRIKANDTQNGCIPANSKSPEIKIRAVKDGFTAAGRDLELCRDAIDMIKNAWGNKCTIISNELYWALIIILRCIPETRTDSGLHNAIQDYLNWIADGKTQSQAVREFKGEQLKGISGNSCVAVELGYAFAKSFMNSNKCKPRFKSVFQLKKIINKDKDDSEYQAV